MHQRMGYEKHVKGQFHSFRLGVAKPDPKFFTCIIEVLDVDPARTLFIDDLEENVRAAWSVGLIARRLDLESGTAGLEAILRDHALLRPKTTTDA